MHHLEYNHVHAIAELPKVELPPTITKTIEELPVELPVEVTPEGGFPWCGVGIGVGVVVLAAVCAKLYKCTSKK